MPPKSRSPKPSAPFSGWLRRSTLLLLLLFLVCAVLGGVIWAGHWGLEQLQGHRRYEVPFADVECEPPVGMDRQDFLDEVRYVSRLPKRLNVTDENLVSQLQTGFALHPWVEKVSEVQIKPPKQIVVNLAYRAPVLAVMLGEKLVAVDRAGILLPANAPTRGLPIYEGEAHPPRGPAGTRWGDPNVEAAARMEKK